MAFIEFPQLYGRPFYTVAEEGTMAASTLRAPPVEESLYALCHFQEDPQDPSGSREDLSPDGSLVVDLSAWLCGDG